MQPKNFIRRTEDFACAHCGTEVIGSGYTNHCPNCLWSKHVDNLPGDRANPCQGLMCPVGVDLEGEEYIITHECQRCKALKRNKAAIDDNRDQLIALINA